MGKKNNKKKFKNEGVGAGIFAEKFRDLGLTISDSSGDIVTELPVDEGPHAPYNFVPICENVLEDPKQGKYNVITDDTYNGEICYRVTAKTPIIVDDGKDEFYCNKDGVYAIPGSTMRGLIRNNLQILGFSGVREDIDDYHLMYRAVAGGCLRKEYAHVLGQGTQSIKGKQMTVLKNVKAGYISREGDKYFLYNHIDDGSKSKKSSNNEPDYYVVNEGYVLDKAKDNFQYVIDRFQSRLSAEEYTPYWLPVSYALSDNRVCGIAEENKLDRSGCILSSGRMEGKKAFYVIPAIDETTKREIPEDAVTTYQIDYNRRLNTLPKEPKEVRLFYQLPEDGETRPVFYVELDEKLYFGYTPRLRLMYEHSIPEGVHQNSSVTQDFARTIFGFSDEGKKDEGKKDSRKSKVFFTDAVLVGGSRPVDEKKLILGEPNPASYLEYLEQKDGQKVATYNSKNFHIRGIKQYWLHKGITDGLASDKENVKSTLHPLKAGCNFDGKVRFQNLSKEELGLLIWSIVLEEDSLMNVGKAKAYGYGQIKIDKVEMSLLNPRAFYTADPVAFTVSPFEKQTKEKAMEFVDAYKQFASNQLGYGIMENKSIKDFFAMKSRSNLMEGRTVEYMALSSSEDPNGDKGYKEYKQGNNPLPTVQGICDNEKIKKENNGG